jgi:hypothetical protein
MIAKNPAAVALGAKGGKSKTPAQQIARKANLIAARVKRWPAKTKPKESMRGLFGRIRLRVHMYGFYIYL